MRLRRRRRTDGTFYPINAHDNARRREAWHAHAYEDVDTEPTPLSWWERLRRWFRGMM